MHFTFETGSTTSYLHEHIDMTLNHRYGEGAIALKLNRNRFYDYIMGRLIREAGWNPRDGIFIRIRRVMAYMGKSYMQKQHADMRAKAAEQKEHDIMRLVDAGVPRDTARTLVEQRSAR